MKTYSKRHQERINKRQRTSKLALIGQGLFLFVLIYAIMWVILVATVGMPW